MGGEYVLGRRSVLLCTIALGWGLVVEVRFSSSGGVYFGTCFPGTHVVYEPVLVRMQPA